MVVTSEEVIDSPLLCQTSLQRDPSAGKLGTHPVPQTQASGGSDRPRAACLLCDTLGQRKLSFAQVP